MAPHLINFAKTIAIDKIALNNLKMERQTATYKIRYGLAELEHQRLVNTMQNNSFSLNIDESTIKSSKQRVLNILVSYFCDKLQKPICNLYIGVVGNL